MEPVAGMSLWLLGSLVERLLRLAEFLDSAELSEAITRPGENLQASLALSSGAEELAEDEADHAYAFEPADAKEDLVRLGQVGESFVELPVCEFHLGDVE
jgi:hypothetical protein